MGCLLLLAIYGIILSSNINCATEITTISVEKENISLSVIFTKTSVIFEKLPNHGYSVSD